VPASGQTEGVSVSRETVANVVARFGVLEPEWTTDALYRLLEALAAEPDPPTTVREPGEALDVHVADSLTGLEVPELRGTGRIADVGAGAGFPGLVLAAALPEARVDLVEAGRRKCDVIERLAAAAGLEHRARAVASRAEEWARTERSTYDAVTARAIAPLAVICEYAAPLMRIGGVLVAWKGARRPDEEASAALAAAELGLSTPTVNAVTPFEGSHNRHLYVYSKVTETPAEFPRRAGRAAKKPLGSSANPRSL
jgi:16S rRNA (guanine527-N7)-methyltransferase